MGFAPPTVAPTYAAPTVAPPTPGLGDERRAVVSEGQKSVSDDEGADDGAQLGSDDLQHGSDDDGQHDARYQAGCDTSNGPDAADRFLRVPQGFHRNGHGVS